MKDLDVNAVTSDQMLEMSGVIKQMQKNERCYNVMARLMTKQGNCIDHTPREDVWASSSDIAKIRYATKYPIVVDEGPLGDWIFSISLRD